MQNVARFEFSVEPDNVWFSRLLLYNSAFTFIYFFVFRIALMLAKLQRNSSLSDAK